MNEIMESIQKMAKAQTKETKRAMKEFLLRWLEMLGDEPEKKEEEEKPKLQWRVKGDGHGGINLDLVNEGNQRVATVLSIDNGGVLHRYPVEVSLLKKFNMEYTPVRLDGIGKIILGMTG